MEPCEAFKERKKQRFSQGIIEFSLKVFLHLIISLSYILALYAHIHTKKVYILKTGR